MSSSSTMFVFPDCIPLTISKDPVTIAHPTWPVYGFLIGFFIGALLAALLVVPCLKCIKKKKQEDEEVATIQAQGIPMHLRGQRIRPTTIIDDSGNMKSVLKNGSAGGELERATSPSHVGVETDVDNGLSDALIKSTGDGAMAEIASQDVRDFLSLEDRLRQERIDGFLSCLGSLLDKLVTSDKIEQEQADQISNDMKTRCVEIVQNCKNEEIAAEMELRGNPKFASNTVALQTEIEKLHPVFVQRMNSQLSEVEADVTRQLNGYEQLSDEEIEKLMAKLTHQLASREKRVVDETQRQIQMLENKLARRKELAEQNKLMKEQTKEKIESKIKLQKTSLDTLVNDMNLTEKQKDAIMMKYEDDLWKLHSAQEEERNEQEKLLNEKLRKQRQVRLKKLAVQQNKDKKTRLKQLNVATNISDAETYQGFVRKQEQEFEEVVAELDNKEADQICKLIDGFTQSTDFSQQLDEIDEDFSHSLTSNASVNENVVNKIMKLHKAEMKQFERNRKAEQKVAQAKLEEKLALRQQKRKNQMQEQAQSFQIIRVQQEETITKVLEGQPDLTEEAAKRIMEEHNKNMDSLNTQLTISRLRQEKQLEERMAARRAKLAAKSQQKEMLRLLDAGKREKEELKIAVDIDTEKKKLKAEHGQALDSLKQRLNEETQQALIAQEQQISQLIGQLEVGRARRKNIIQKQEKLLAELQDQLANKVGDNPKGYTTTTELMQRHYGQVATLTESLQTTKERQEQALQEKLEMKKLHREAEIREQMKKEAQAEIQTMRARGAGNASNILMDMMLQQRHQKAMDELEMEMKLDLEKQRNEMNEQLNAELMSALSDEGKTFMADLAASSNLSNEELTEAMHNAASTINVNDQTVKKLSKEMRTRVKSAKGERQRQKM